MWGWPSGTACATATGTTTLTPPRPSSDCSRQAGRPSPRTRRSRLPRDEPGAGRLMPRGARLVARNAGVQVVGDTAGKLVSLAFYIVLARELGPDGFGLFTFGVSLAL